MRERLSKHSQFLSFAAIGVANTLLHGGVLMLAVDVFLWSVTLSHLLAFAIANLFSYLLNSQFTFKRPLSFKRYWRFFMASLLSLMITLLLAKAVDLYGAHYLVGFVLVVIFVPVISFLVMRFWVFSARSKTTTR